MIITPREYSIVSRIRLLLSKHRLFGVTPNIYIYTHECVCMCCTWCCWCGGLIIFRLDSLSKYPVDFHDVYTLAQLILQLCESLLSGDLLPCQALHLVLILLFFPLQSLQETWHRTLWIICTFNTHMKPSLCKHSITHILVSVWHICQSANKCVSTTNWCLSLWIHIGCKVSISCLCIIITNNYKQI